MDELSEIADILEDRSTPAGLREAPCTDGPERIDRLFTDVIIPGGVDGRQLAIEAGKRRQALKVLYASGHAETPSCTMAGSTPACCCQSPISAPISLA